ncbi:MAG: (2Fe-2S) ferredoxin domain-containing protein [Cyanothece sp. SIO2G6]|nr:(2Fe-2S) ferredoxin domain-containing protein [Cyanothece sp. SIO2G6]
MPTPRLAPFSNPMEHYTSDTVHVLQGQYIDSEQSSKGQLKWIQLQHEHGKEWIKLPKTISYSLLGRLQSGMVLKVWVRPHKDYIKALMIIPVAQAVQRHAGQSAIAQPAAPKIGNPPILGDRTPTSPPLSPSSAQPAPQVYTITVCTKGKCGKQGSGYLLRAFEAAIRERGLGDRITVRSSGCCKNCKHSPTVRIFPGALQYSGVRTSDIPRILDRCLANLLPA